METINLTQPVLCIVGPTASGKTELSQCIAQSVDGEIISADSMQVYRGMDIGTGKIPECERVVPHYGIDLVDPDEPYSAALFQDYARNCFADIDTRLKRSILVGGTGFYVRAAIDGYDFVPGELTDNPVREYYTQYAEEHGRDALWDLLNECDPASARIIHPHNVRRVIRAFELLGEGTSYAQQKDNLVNITQKIPATFIGLSVEPDILSKRIDARVDTMIELGLVDEVKGLLEKGFREALTAAQAIGYKEIVAALDNQCSLVEAIDAIKRATRRYAKRQRTWFRNDERITWIDANIDMDSLVDEAMSLLGY